MWVFRTPPVLRLSSELENSGVNNGRSHQCCSVSLQLCQEDKVHGGGRGQPGGGVLLPKPGSVSRQRQPGQQLARRGARYVTTPRNETPAASSNNSPAILIPHLTPALTLPPPPPCRLSSSHIPELTCRSNAAQRSDATMVQCAVGASSRVCVCVCKSDFFNVLSESVISRLPVS